MSDKPLCDRRILVVEDEFMLADELCRNLERAGAVVVGPAPSIDLALGLVRGDRTIDAALLDMGLRGEMAYTVAEALVGRSVPFIFTSGFDDSVLAERYALIPRCQKPTDFNRIVQELTTMLPEYSAAQD